MGAGVSQGFPPPPICSRGERVETEGLGHSGVKPDGRGPQGGAARKRARTPFLLHDQQQRGEFGTELSRLG